MTEKEKIKLVVTMSFGFLVAYFVFLNNVFLWISGLLLFITFIKKKISFLIADFMIYVFSCFYNILLEILIFLLYFSVIFPFAILWRFFNSQKINYFFKNIKRSMFLDFKDEIDFKNKF